MPKQTIEIDVRDGYEVGGKCETYDSYTKKYWITLYLIKKEPEYLEVREFLARAYDGVVVHYSAQKGISNTKNIEESTSFIRWIDQDWRKVEI